MTSYKTAVEQKCKECIYDPIVEGTWKQQVEDCPSVTCPLHPVRPKSKSTKGETKGDTNG